MRRCRPTARGTRRRFLHIVCVRSILHVWNARLCACLYIATETDLLITGDLAGVFHHLAGHSAGAAPNTPTDVDCGGFRKDCHPTNLYELVSQFILNPCVQKVPKMICEACFLVQLCNSEQNVTTWSSAVTRASMIPRHLAHQ